MIKRKPSLPLDPLYLEAGDETLKVRTSKRVARKLEWLAETYAGGNLSLWLRYAALEAPRRYLVSPKKEARAKTKPRGK